MMAAILPVVLHGNRESLDAVAQQDSEVDDLHESIIAYLGEISKHSLSDEQTHALIHLMEAVNDLENVGDVIETNLVFLGKERIDRSVSISPATQEVLTAVHDVVAVALRTAVEALTSQDPAKATKVVGMKQDINALVERAASHEARRLVAKQPGRTAAYAVEMDILEKLKRIYYFAKRIAKAVAPPEQAAPQ